jgi:hypothetical protein
MSYQYDAAGNQTAVLGEWDDGGDGVVESRSGYFYTFDAAGHTLTETYKSDLSADGTTYGSLTTDTYTYDSFGLAFQTRSEADNDGNGTIDELETHTLVRDAQGRPVSKLSVIDANNDGTPEETAEVTATWSASVVMDAEFLEDVLGWYY